MKHWKIKKSMKYVHHDEYVRFTIIALNFIITILLQPVINFSMTKERSRLF